MARGARPMAIKYRGLESPEFAMPGYYCECVEGVVTGRDMRVSDRQLNLLKARTEKVLLPKAVKRVRKTLGLTQKDAGTLLGGGPKAFQKYESADLVPSKAISNLLRVLEHNPSVIEVLRGEYEPQAAEMSV